jgi:hypothetical protein
LENRWVNSQVQRVDIQSSGGILETHQGNLSRDSLEQLRAFLFQKYNDYYAQGKVLNFTKGFLKYQAKLTLDPRYLAFDIFLRDQECVW